MRRQRRSLPLSLSVGLLLALGTLGLVLPMGVFEPTAAAAPSNEDVERAREQERIAEMNVAQIEVAIAQAMAEAEEAEIDAQFAAEALTAAQERLDQAMQAAHKAEIEAEAAEVAYEEGRKQLGSIVQLTYRSGGELDALAPYVKPEGLREVEQRRAAVSSFSGSAEQTIQEVAALKQVADLLTDVAQQAQAAEEDAFALVEQRSVEAAEQLKQAQAVVSQVESTKSALLDELAVRRGTTARLEAERLAEAQRIREQERRDALLAAQPPAGDTSSSTPSTPEPSPAPAPTPAPAPSPAPTPAPAPAPTPAPSPAPAPAPAPAPKPKPTPTPTPPSSSGSIQTVINYARSKIGAPYVWAGNGPGFDCSGITYMAYKQIGVTLPRTASGQYYVGTRVPFSQARAGDLVFWARNGSIYHVAMYSGNGRIISAHKPGWPLDEGPLYSTELILPYVVRVI